jgi:hypothetical protein
VAWQFAGQDPEARERTALKVIALSFFALAGYVTVESVRSLTGAETAGHSTVGIVLAAVSLVIMPLLSYAQRRAGRELGSTSAVADSRQTLLCTYSVEGAAGRAAPQQPVRPVMGRSDLRPDHRWGGRQGRRGSLMRQALLLLRRRR